MVVSSSTTPVLIPVLNNNNAGISSKTISLSTNKNSSSSTSTSTITIGRMDILSTIWSSCSNNNNKNTKKNDSVCRCKYCKDFEWIAYVVSRKCIQIILLEQSITISAQIIFLPTKYSQAGLLRIIRNNKEREQQQCSSDGSFGPYELQSGDIIRFMKPADRKGTPYIDFQYVNNQLISNSAIQRPSSTPMVDQKQRPEERSLDDTIDVEENIQPLSHDEMAKEEEMKENSQNNNSQDMKMSFMKNSECCRENFELNQSSAENNDGGKRKQLRDCNELTITDKCQKNREIKLNDHQQSNNQKNSNIREEAVMHKYQSPSKRSKTDSSMTSFVTPSKSNNNDNNFLLYIVEKGKDMHKTAIYGDGKKIKGIRDHIEQRGGIVLNTFNKNVPPYPKYIIISETITTNKIIWETLGFTNEEECRIFFGEHDIICVKKSWATYGNEHYKPPFHKPTMKELYLGLHPISPIRNNKKKQQSTTISISDSSTSTTTLLQTKVTRRNMELSDHFRTISKLYRECPLDDKDEWRSYMFQLIAGRLQRLDFDVIDNTDVLKKLKCIPGFGNSTLVIVEDFLRTGTSGRYKSIQTDKRRMAMQSFMNIWGVGRKRALELVEAGYQRIGSVRQAVKMGSLKLDRNQYIGLLCYDDILEEMSRPEVEAIAEIVFDTVRQRYPSAEMEIMGSYRRGSNGCGDVDILITHPDYQENIPPKALGQIVDELRTAGHIQYHLTFISGMKHEKFETLPESAASKITAGTYGRARDKADNFNTATWMGVFNSPLIPGKSRRVDIKFYPYQVRIFASLYFTGNGHFNRSMRLWASRKFNCNLTDHGIFDKVTKKNLLKDPKSEKDVFEFLRLKWKNPNERDFFDAVESIDGGESSSDATATISQSEIIHDGSNHVWVK